MTQHTFDDSRLDDPEALAGIDEHLRELAGAGARVRVLAQARLEAHDTEALQGLRPRGVIALGAEARLLRAMLEPVCPVPFVAWQSGTLPGWVGPLDLVVLLASGGSEPELMAAAADAVRRGATVLVAAQPGSPIAEQAASRATLVLPTPHQDPMATVIATLTVLHALGLGPSVDPEQIARSADEVAQRCSPHQDIANNPAKDVALALADSEPLVWGGSVLAARASRRIAEALRRASGRPALAADAAALLPVVEASTPRDTFSDPFDDDAQGLPRVLLVVDDGSQDERVRRERSQLLASAERQGVRVCTLSCDPQPVGELDRYVALLQLGLYCAAYLALGLGSD